MNIIDTKIPELKIIEPRVFGDERGFFFESFQAERYAELVGIRRPFVQDNVSRSSRGVLRGLHYQTEHTQGKLVSVLRGKVFDVAVDIRQGSPTFGQWVGVELSEENKRQFWVPEGFAHGFYVMSETADFTYKCTDYYHPEFEVSIRFDDPDIGIEWPYLEALQLSKKDEAGERLNSLAPELLPTYQG